jgi:hypothetical protein
MAGLIDDDAAAAAATAATAAATATTTATATATTAHHRAQWTLGLRPVSLTRKPHGPSAQVRFTAP